MALSKESRIKIFIVIDLIFFFLEIVVGYYAHSLALVADAFHMLNDVISLFVGLWAVRVANTQSSNTYTYGWARAEILGGLVNGVFLIALCLTIFLEAIQRFFEPQKVSNPMLVFYVGAVGLAFNILGLFVFHQPHSHDHEEHGHEHSDELATAEQGHSHAHTASDAPYKDVPAIQDAPASADHEPNAPQNIERTGSRASAANGFGHSRKAGSRSFVEDMSIYPGSIRDSIRYQARMGDDMDDPEASDSNADITRASERTPLLGNGTTSSSQQARKRSSAIKREASDSNISHQKHHHTNPEASGKTGGHGHNHADMNIRGMFLHVLGDALGNVGVMASALIIRFFVSPYRHLADPIISLIITGIILKSAWPLVRDTARPLLQAVPEGLDVMLIKEDIESLPGVKNVHHLHVWALTPTKRIATLDVTMDFEYEVQKYMQLAREIKLCLHGFGIHSSTIQPEFSDSELLCDLDCVDDADGANKCCPPGQGSGSATPHENGVDSHSHSHDEDHSHAGHAH